MGSLLDFFRSSIGKKVVMAVTGLALFGFVVAHMLGNLQVYFGPTKLDEYGAALRRVPALLWSARLGLLAAAALHVWAAWSLTLANRAARPVGYRQRQDHAATYASRTMRWSGVILLLFIVYHLLHFTTGQAHPQFVEGAVNHNFVTGFRVPWVSAFYVLAMLCLGLHMYHGVWSMMQTVGLSHPRYNHLRVAFATFIAALVVAGNISFPVAVLAGLVREAPRTAATAPAQAR
ncbi:MAG: succinate dehydrogenase cytochrome b subunit [Acidobacteria bacterium]|nr:succinate dehydrogenase cytochrome b subunit [Acidobacteriota bacterium]